MASIVRTVAAMLALACGSYAHAQSLGYTSPMFVPVIAQTNTYQSEIYIHNPGLGAVSVALNYYGATGSATPGLTPCPTINVPPGLVIQTSLLAACPALNPGSNFGALDSLCCNSGIAIYTRVQAVGGDGFSIEGMVDSSSCCSPVVREVIGIKRQAAPPGYQTNCFLWNREARAGRIVATLALGNGAFVADQIIDIASNEVIRQLDVFAALGAPAGDYSNARVNFQSITPIAGGSPVTFFAACTVQNNATFDADFRVAKWHS